MSVISNVQSMISRTLLAMRAGLQYGDKRNLYQQFGYKYKLVHEDYVAKYLRQDISKRINDAPVSATWTDPPVLEGGEAFNTAWQELVQSGIVYPALNKVDSFAGLGMFALLVIGFDDSKPLKTPVTQKAGRKILYLQPYLEGSCTITKYEEDDSSPRFGLPTMYQIQPGQIDGVHKSAKTSVMGRKPFEVHWTRVLHVADGTLEDQVFGHSRLEPIYNLLDDLLKVVGGSAETYWMVANRGMQIDIDKDMEMNEEDAENLTAEIEEYQHQMRRFIRTRGVKIENLGSDTTDPTATVDVTLSLISACTGIPKRVLMGSEAGQLASQQDRANWSTRIAERTINFAEPKVLRPFLTLLVMAGVLPEWKGLVIEWPDAYKMSPLERAQTAAQMARSMTNAVKALSSSRDGVGETVFTIEEVREAVSFGKHLPVFRPTPQGTLLSKMGKGPLDADPIPPVVDPNAPTPGLPTPA